MGRPRKMENMFTPSRSTIKGNAQQGDAGYDNPRENIDPHIRTKVVSSKETTTTEANVDNDLTVGNDITVGGCVTINGTGTTIFNGEVEFKNNVTFVGSGSLAFGNISVKDNTTESAIAVAGTPVQVTIFDTNGESNNTTPDHTNDHITITKAGIYSITISASVEGVGAVANKMSLEAYKNNGATILTGIHGHRNLSGGGGDVGSITISGLADLALNDTVEVWITNDTNDQNYIVEDISMTIIQVAG